MIIMMLGFWGVGLVTSKAYPDAPPIRLWLSIPQGRPYSGQDDILGGQEVFLRYGVPLPLFAMVPVPALVSSDYKKILRASETASKIQTEKQE